MELRFKLTEIEQFILFRNYNDTNNGDFWEKELAKQL